MGCCSSRQIPVNETKKNFNDIKDESSIKKTEPGELKTEYKINLIYRVNPKKIYQIFGENFVKKNKNNIELVIDGKPSILVDKYELNIGDNNVTMIIKNKLIDISYMFSQCKFLKDISELKYLDVSESKTFENMFSGCAFISDIKSLENWNVSNCNNFEGMFSGCHSLSDISPLENWDVSNGTNFKNMFNDCISLSDLKGLERWDVSKATNFSYMFYFCSALININPLKNWNVSNCNNFENMFNFCLRLIDINPLKNWNISNGSNVDNMFTIGFPSLEDLRPKKK